MPALRWGAAVYGVVLIGTYLVASPLGGNVSRLNQYAAGPLLVCALWDRRRGLVFLLAIPLVFWQWFPTFDTIAFARSDPSTHRAYYQPLLRLHRQRTEHVRARRDTRDVPTLGNDIRLAPAVVGAWMGTPTRLRVRPAVLRPHARRNELSHLALGERGRVRRVARHPARRFLVDRSPAHRAGTALPEAGLARRALAGVEIHRLSRPRRRPGAPRVDHRRQLHARGHRTRPRDRARSRLTALGRAGRRLHGRRRRRLDRVAKPGTWQGTSRAGPAAAPAATRIRRSSSAVERPAVHDDGAR